MSNHTPDQRIGLSLQERLAWGKSLRRQTPRSAHAVWKPGSDRPDPVGMIEATSAGRLPALVPIRHGRMLASPFTFLRASAAAMACDLAATPVSGLTVQLCGDCHLLNFGIFATPERNLVFDINDFDETLPGPWEWDVKRLATSFVVAGRSENLSERHCRDAAETAVRAYREHLRAFMHMSVLELWYHQLDTSLLARVARHRSDRKRRRLEAAKARRETTTRIFPRMTEISKGRRRIADHPPRIFHLPPGDPLERELHEALAHYPKTLQDHRRFQLSRYEMVDLAMKVVGVGSVGTRCGVFLMMASKRDPLFLQVKEARASVLEPYVGVKSAYRNQGQRVVAGQRLLQASSDIFIGWSPNAAEHHYYFRQLRDSKGDVEVKGMSASSLCDHALACGWALARAHAKSGDAAALTGYLGPGDAFDLAVARFATQYADQTERDHAAMQAAVRAGRLEAQTDGTE